MAAQRVEFHKPPFAVLRIHSECCPDKHRSGNDTETDADPLGEQPAREDEQVLALEPLELRAAAYPLVDRILRHVTGRMSVRWWQPR